MRVFLNVGNVLYIDLSGVILMYTYVNVHQVIHSRFLSFAGCNSYLSFFLISEKEKGLYI